MELKRLLCLLEERLIQLSNNRKEAQSQIQDVCTKELDEVNSLEKRINEEIHTSFVPIEGRILNYIKLLSSGDPSSQMLYNNNFNVIQQAQQELSVEQKYEIQYSMIPGKGFSDACKLNIISFPVNNGTQLFIENNGINTMDSITNQLQRHLEKVRESVTIAQNQLIGICTTRRNEIKDLENKINSKIEVLFTQENTLIQNSINMINEKGGNGTPDELRELVIAAKTLLIIKSKYVLSNLFEFSLCDSYDLTVSNEISFGCFDFEERKPSSIIPSFTDKNKISLSLSFFGVDEIELLREYEYNIFLKVIMMIWEKGQNEDSAKTYTKEYIISDSQPIVFDEIFSQNKSYCLKIKIVHDNSSTKWSDEVEITSKSNDDYYVWKECPDNVNEERKYSVDANNHRIAIMVGVRYSTIIGNAPLPLNKTSSWNIKILGSKENGLGILIGVAPSDIDQNEDNMLKCGWYYHCHSSTLWSGPPHNYWDNNYGPIKERGQCVHTGDSVGVVMNMEKGELSFNLNEENLGVAYEGIPLDKPLVPCVLLLCGGDSVEFIDPTSAMKENVDGSVPAPSNAPTNNDSLSYITPSTSVIENLSLCENKGYGNNALNVPTIDTSMGQVPPSSTTNELNMMSINENSNMSNGNVNGINDKTIFDNCVWRKCPSEAKERRVYSVEENNPRIATKIGGNGCCTIIGNATLPFDKISSWNIKILRSKYNNGSCIWVGVAPSDIDQCNGDSLKCGWYYDCCNSALISGPPHNYKGKIYGPRKEKGEYVHMGDFVSVIVDVMKSKISFSVNGVNLGVAYESVPLDKPLTPCALLGFEGSSVELDFSETKENEINNSFPIPSNIVANCMSSNSITLTWDPIEGIEFYQIEVDGTNSGDASTTNKFVKRDFLPDTEHTFRIRIVKDSSVSGWSDVVKMRTIYKEFSANCVWKECPGNVEFIRGYYIDEKNPRIASMIANGTGGCCTITGNMPIPFEKVITWGIKIAKSQSNNGHNVCIGVAPSDINQNVGDNFGKYGWYFNCFTSALWSGPPHNYKGIEYGPRKGDGGYVQTGAIVGVVIDTAKGDLSFAIDEINLGVAYSMIPLNKPLVPCVLLYHENDSIELCSFEVGEAEDYPSPVLSKMSSNNITWESITSPLIAYEDVTFSNFENDRNKMSDPSTVKHMRGSSLSKKEYGFKTWHEKKNSLNDLSDAMKGKTQKYPPDQKIWAPCPDYVDYNRGYYVNKNFKGVSKIPNSNDGCCTIIGSSPIPLKIMLSWDIKIQKSRNNGYNIVVGVAPSDIRQNDDNYNKCGWYFNCYCSILWSGPPHNCKGKAYGPRKKDGEYVHNGSSVGVMMDTIRGELSFALDGVNLGVAFACVPLDKPLVPCVILYYSSDVIEADSFDVKENTIVSVPSNIVAKSITRDSITLTWDVVEWASFYQVEVDGKKPWNEVTTNVFNQPEPVPDTEHSFRVRAVRGNDVSEWSAVVKGRSSEKPFETCTWKEFSDDIVWKMKYSVDAKNPRIARKGGNGWCTIMGNLSFPRNKVTSWIIKIQNSKDNDGNGIYIGVSPFDINQTDDANHEKCGWYLSCFSFKLWSGPPHNNRDKKYGPKKKDGQYVRTDDSVGAVMDTTKGQLSFILNDKYRGVAYEGIPLDKPLIPCVVLQNKGDIIELCPGPGNLSDKSCIIS